MPDIDNPADGLDDWVNKGDPPKPVRSWPTMLMFLVGFVFAGTIGWAIGDTGSSDKIDPPKTGEVTVLIDGEPVTMPEAELHHLRGHDG